MSNSGSSSSSATASSSSGDKRKPDSKEDQKDHKDPGPSAAKKLKNASGGASAVAQIHPPKGKEEEEPSVDKRSRELVMDEFRREVAVILRDGSTKVLGWSIWAAAHRACDLYKAGLVGSQLVRLDKHVEECDACAQREDESDVGSDRDDDEENTQFRVKVSGAKDAIRLRKLADYAEELQCRTAFALFDKQTPISDYYFAPPSAQDVCCCAKSHGNTPTAVLTCDYLRKLVTAMCGLNEETVKMWQSAFNHPKEADADSYSYHCSLAPFLMENATAAFKTDVKDFVEENDAEKAKKKLVALFRGEYMKV
jgi:hypothetical protein